MSDIMPLKIFTIPFNFEKNRFDTMEIDDFCQNKKINHQQASFFEMDGTPYWTILVDYEVLVSKDNVLHKLSKSQKALYMRLKEWRKTKAEELGFPVFLVATNKQLEQMVLQKCTTISALENIKGYGKKKTANYGQEIIAIIKRFYEHGKK